MATEREKLLRYQGWCIERTKYCNYLDGNAFWLWLPGEKFPRASGSLEYIVKVMRSVL